MSDNLVQQPAMTGVLSTAAGHPHSHQEGGFCIVCTIADRHDVSLRLITRPRHPAEVMGTQFCFLQHTCPELGRPMKFCKILVKLWDEFLFVCAYVGASASRVMN